MHTSKEYQERKAKENNISIDRLRYLGLQFKPEPPPPTSPETLRKLGVFKTKPIVSCDRGEEAGEYASKVTHENFQIKCKTIMDFMCHNTVDSDAPSPQMMETDQPSTSLMTEDERLFKMYFSHLNAPGSGMNEDGKVSDFATSSLHIKVPGSDPKTNSASDVDSNENASSCSKSTSSRNGDSLEKSSTGSNGYCSQQSSSYSANQSQPNSSLTVSGRSTLNAKQSTKRKRNNRMFHDYFNANRKDIRMYSLIRHSFSSEYDLEYFKLPHVKEELKRQFEICRNHTIKMIPETEELVPCKVLLISQHAIKQAKKSSNRKYRPPSHSSDKNVQFEPFLFRKGLNTLREECKQLSKLFVATDGGPYYRVICGKNNTNSGKRIININQFDHEYITPDMSMASIQAFVDMLERKNQSEPFTESNRISKGAGPRLKSRSNIEVEIITDHSHMTTDSFERQLRRHNKRKPLNLCQTMLLPTFLNLIYVNQTKHRESWGEGLSSKAYFEEQRIRESHFSANPHFKFFLDEVKSPAIKESILEESEPILEDIDIYTRILDLFAEYQVKLDTHEVIRNFHSLGYIIDYCKRTAANEERTEFDKLLWWTLEYWLKSDFKKETLDAASKRFAAERKAKRSVATQAGSIVE